MELNAEEWNDLAPAERLRRCSQWAGEAIKLADKAPDNLRDGFIMIGEGWLMLAAEIEREIERANLH